MKIEKLMLPFVFSIFMAFTGCIMEENEKIMKQVENDENFLTSIEWKNKTQDFGTIEEGQKLEVIYGFTNTGKKPLVIKSVNASCGCTVPERPEEPIMPGKTGIIKAVFDSRGRPGNNHKTISVVANSEPEESHVLAFDVNVNAAKTEAQPQ